MIVLLVDDDATQLKLGALRLRDAGFDVVTAQGGDEALAKVKEVTPDAIMSDVLMEDIDGFGLCRQLRRDPSLANVPILLLSAHYHGQPDQQLAVHVGASELITRSPEFDAELAALQRMLSARVPAVEPLDPIVYDEHLRTNAHRMAKLLERARSAEDRYRTLFENASDGMALLTADGVIVEANQRWRSILGRDPATMIGLHVRDFAPRGREDEYVATFVRGTSRTTGREPPIALATADGRTVYVEFSVSNIDIDGNRMVLTIGRDVTEQVLAAAELAAAEEKYRSLVERIPDVIWTSDTSGTITFMTSNAKQVFGYTAEEIMAEPPETRYGRIHPQDRDRVVAMYTALMQDGTPFDVEFRRQHKDGHWVWLRNRTIASYERGGVRQVEGMVSDITERRRLEESLRHAQKMEAIGQLTGGIAHDFNNLLSVVLANSQFLCEDLLEHDPRRADAEEIAAAAERAAALTRQLLAFSRHQVFESNVVDLDSVVVGIEKMLRRLIGEDIEFSVDRGDAGNVLVDVGQIEQVIVNLVVNARDAMPAGGRLSIETASANLGEVAAQRVGIPAGQYAVLSVTDTGCGMDAETKRRIFEPFFTTKEVGKGTGLGLSTSYGIVHQSGGHIVVASEVGQGTTFHVYLPRSQSEPRLHRKSTRITLGGDETILVVEDDVGVRTAVTRMLRSRGYRLLIATNPEEALALVGSRKIDLMIADVVMPGMSGPDLVERVAARCGDVRTLYMSGYSDHAALRAPLAAGTAFVQKPFSPDSFAKKVREVLDA